MRIYKWCVLVAVIGGVFAAKSVYAMVPMFDVSEMPTVIQQYVDTAGKFKANQTALMASIKNGQALGATTTGTLSCSFGSFDKSKKDKKSFSFSK